MNDKRNELIEFCERLREWGIALPTDIRDCAINEHLELLSPVPDAHRPSCNLTARPASCICRYQCGDNIEGHAIQTKETMSYISKADREKIRIKYGGRCAYSGTPLEDDWQVDHIKPLIRHPFTGTPQFPTEHKTDNLVPCQAIINHYKGSLDLETFKRWFMGGLHERLAKLPKNPRTEKSIKRIAYLRKVASYFGITEDTPFSGTFYFEQHP